MSDELKIHIASAKVDDGLLDYQVQNCPTCNVELQFGFGLAGGGFGAYGFCEPCGKVVWKCVTDE